MRGAMRRTLAICAGTLFTLGLAQTALANPDLELASGTDVIFWDGAFTPVCFSGGASVACSTFGVGTLGGTLAASNFNGWDVRNDTGTSFSPSCNSTESCLTQDQANVVNVGASTDLLAYFADSGFTAEPTVNLTETGSSFNGTVGAKGYAYTGGLGLGAPNGTVTLGSPFGTLSLTGSGNQALSAGPVAGPTPAAPYNLAASFDFTPGVAGSGYTVTETISAVSAVPEPGGVVLFGGYPVVDYDGYSEEVPESIKSQPDLESWGL